jgi:hypothetical protein
MVGTPGISCLGNLAAGPRPWQEEGIYKFLATCFDRIEYQGCGNQVEVFVRD